MRPVLNITTEAGGRKRQVHLRLRLPLKTIPILRVERNRLHGRIVIQAGAGRIPTRTPIRVRRIQAITGRIRIPILIQTAHTARREVPDSMAVREVVAVLAEVVQEGLPMGDRIPAQVAADNFSLPLSENHLEDEEAHLNRYYFVHRIVGRRAGFPQ